MVREVEEVVVVERLRTQLQKLHGTLGMHAVMRRTHSECQEYSDLKEGQQVAKTFSEKDIALYISRTVEIQNHSETLRQ